MKIKSIILVNGMDYNIDKQGSKIGTYDKKTDTFILSGNHNDFINRTQTVYKNCKIQ